MNKPTATFLAIALAVSTAVSMSVLKASTAQADLASQLRGAPPFAVAQLLAESRIAAGMEVVGSDMLARGRLELDPAEKARMTNEQFSEAFNRVESEYQSRIVEGVVVIRPVVNRSSYLDGPAPSMVVDEVGLMRVVRRLFAPLNPNLVGRGGEVGSRLTTDGVDVDFGDRLQINANWTRMTILEALNDVARRAPGHVWIVVTNQETGDAVERVGLAHGLGHAAFVSTVR